MAWIKSPADIGRHPFTRRLSRHLEISVPQAIGHLHYLWWWTLDYAPSGVLADFSNDEIARAAEWEGDAQSFISAMALAGFLDSEDGAWRVALWDRIKPPWAESPMREAWEMMRPSVAPLIYKRDGYTCRYCGSTVGPFHIDHIIPIARGGTNALDNLTTACAPCNQSKGARLIEEWRQ